MAATTYEESRADVVLLAPHSHLGEAKKKGDVINVSAEQLKWLIQRGIAERVKAPTKPQAKTTPTPTPTPKDIKP